MQQVQLKTAAAPSLQKQKPNFRVSGGRGAQDRGALLHPDPSPISQHLTGLTNPIWEPQVVKAHSRPV